MRVALVHDYIKEYGGAERVLETLHEIYPDAPVFTSVYLPNYLGPHKERFQNWDIRPSVAQYLPLKAKLISPLRLLSPLLFKRFDFSSYDVIITSATGAYFPNTLRKKQAVLFCYCHTPPRYLYGYATAREWKKHKVIYALASIANHVLRLVDFHASKNVDQYIANSHEVAERIRKFYRKEAKVIYPPVTIQTKFEAKKPLIKNKQDYFLTGGRLARAKHVDIIVKACTELNVPLKVFGKDFAGYEEELKQLAGGSVEFLGEVSDEEKGELMAKAKAFLFASEDEDFGIIPVEAMSYGLPVISHRSGGVRETVLNGETGVFFDELTVESLRDAIQRFGKMKIKPEDCRKQAEKFSSERFKKEIEKIVASKIS